MDSATPCGVDDEGVLARADNFNVAFLSGVSRLLGLTNQSDRIPKVRDF